MRNVLLLLFITITAHAQYSVKGRVVDQETAVALSNVTVTDIKTKKWTITDENGNFKISFKSREEITLHFKILGKQEKTLTFSTSELDKELLITLESQDLRLDEITVFARKGKDFSEIVMGKEVIEQVQAFSLSEVLEQLPGQAITNFDINEFKTIAFRTVKPTRIGNTGFGNKSFGTAIVVDGIPISNNENMQSYDGNYGSPFSPNTLGFGDASANSFNGYFSNANYGADLREIPVQNIENVEVVQGIPSAKYGDLTSGLIKIEQRAGKSPFRIYTSLRDGASEYGISKGFKASDKIGFFNVNLVYLKSNAEPRTSFTEYERITTNIMWSWANTAKNIRNSFSVDYGFNNDNVNYEEEDTRDKIVKNKKKDISISNRFKWNFKESYFDNLDVNFNFRYSDQFTYESIFVNNGGAIVGTSLEEGVYIATYSPPSYTGVKAVEGIPISSFFSADLFKSFSTGNWSHTMSYGISARMSDNKGRGRLGSPESINSIFSNGSGAGSGSQGFRPYNYGDNVKAEYQLSGYVEDNITRDWESSSFVLNAGLRYDNQNGYSNFAPRINTSFAKDNFKIRGGFGLTSKTPSINQIYTGPRYYDAVLGDYRLPGYYNLAIMQTFIDYSDNANLKPSKSLRSELGFDYKFPFGTINITGFYNNLYDGVTNQAIPQTRQVADLQINYNGTQLPTYDIIGYTPFYYTQNQLLNNFSSKDKGVEFFMNFDKTPFRNITFDIQGSFTQTTNFDDVERLSRSTNIATPEKYGVYKSFEEYYKQFRVGGNINYHLPKVGLVVSLRSEHFIIQQNTAGNTENFYAYLDANLNKVIIPEENRNTATYGHIMSSQTLLENRAEKVYNNFHLRISKDFLNGFRFSFYSNNFLDLNQTEIGLENGRYIRRIKPDMVQLSFGTKIEYQF